MRANGECGLEFGLCLLVRCPSHLTNLTQPFPCCILLLVSHYTCVLQEKLPGFHGWLYPCKHLLFALTSVFIDFGGILPCLEKYKSCREQIGFSCAPTPKFQIPSVLKLFHIPLPPANPNHRTASKISDLPLGL